MLSGEDVPDRFGGLGTSMLHGFPRHAVHSWKSPNPTTLVRHATQSRPIQQFPPTVATHDPLACLGEPVRVRDSVQQPQQALGGVGAESHCRKATQQLSFVLQALADSLRTTLPNAFRSALASLRMPPVRLRAPSLVPTRSTTSYVRAEGVVSFSAA